MFYKDEKNEIDDAVVRGFSAPEINKMIVAAVEKAVAALDPVKLADKIEQKINKCWEDMILKMIGFGSSFGRFEVDHCNGRMSHISQLVNEKAGAAVEEFMSRIRNILPNMDVDQKIIDAVQKDYREYFKRDLDNKLRKKAEQDLENFINNKLSKILDGYLDPETEAMRILHQALSKIQDPQVAQLLKQSIGALEAHSIKKMDD